MMLICIHTNNHWYCDLCHWPIYLRNSLKYLAALPIRNLVKILTGTEYNVLSFPFCIAVSSKDKLGLVLYDSGVTSTGSLKAMDSHGKAELTARVEALCTGSCTNLSGGLLEGLAMIEDLQKARGPSAAGEAKKTVSSVLLMTDGQANEGLTSINDIVKCLTPRGRREFYPDGNFRSGHSGGRLFQQVPSPRWQQQQQQQMPSSSGSFFGNLLQSINPFSSSSSTSATPIPASNSLGQQQQQQAPPPMLQQQQQQAPPPMLQQQQQQVPPPMLQQQQQQAPDLTANAAVPPPPPPPPAMPALVSPAEGSQQESSAESVPAANSEHSNVVAASIYTFGFGADHNAELLQALSDAGNGVYFYIDSSEKIPESFADCLGGLLSTAAQNITVDITMENDCKVTHAYAGRSTKSTDSGTNLSLPIGDIQSEECRDLVFCIELPPVPEPVNDWTVMSAKLTCFNVLTSMMEVKEVSLRLTRVATVEEGRTPNPDVDQHRNRITTAQVMENASALADRGDLLQARSMIQQVCLNIGN